MSRAERTRPMSAAARFAIAGLFALSLAACGGGGGGGGTTAPPPQATDSMPSFGSQTIADRTYSRGEAIEPETLPAATGGDGALTYSLSPDPPAGLAFDASARVISGTPTAAQGTTGYTRRSRLPKRPRHPSGYARTTRGYALLRYCDLDSFKSLRRGLGNS